MTMHNALHPKSNVDRLYTPGKEGGRGFQGVEEAVKLTNLGLENCVEEVGNEDRWQWVQNGTLKRETESLIFAAQ